MSQQPQKASPTAPPFNPLAKVDDTLRTPKGQLGLIVLGYSLALVLAVVIAVNRAWFESKRAENLKPPPESVAALASDLDLGKATAADVKALRAYERPLLYDAWMVQEGLRGDGLPRALAEVAPAETRLRLERTLVAGNPEQRARAIELARLSGSEELMGALRWARDRARRMRDAELVRSLDEVLGPDG